MERDQLQPVLWAIALVFLMFVLAPAVDMSLLAIAGWVVVFIVGTFMRVPTPSGNEMSLLFGLASAAPLLITDRAGSVAFASIGIVFALGFLLAWMAHQMMGDSKRITATFIRQSLGALFFVGMYGGVVELWNTDLGRLAAFVAASLAWFVLETVVWAWSEHDARTLSRRYLFRLAAQDWPMAFSLFIAGALFGFSWVDLGLWTILVVFVPFGFAYLAFQRASVARVTYAQTITALARIPEVAGLSPVGHSERTAQVAVAVAQELGMTPDQVREVEYAARMHDIGRITLNEPNIIKMGFTEDDIARWGAEIIGEAPYLRPVAELVKQQHHPYRRPGELRDPDLPIASKIIKASSALDHATHELGFSLLEALEVLHRGAAYDFDPDVVEAVRSVLETGKAMQSPV